MADVRTAWNTAGEQLSGLGLKLKLHYEQQRESAGESGTQTPETDTKADVKDAVKRLGEAVQDAVDALGAAARDDAVKDDVKNVGRSLKDALGATFSEISDELGKAFAKSDTDAAPGPGGPETEPKASAAPQAGTQPQPEPGPKPEPGPQSGPETGPGTTTAGETDRQL